MKDLILEDLYAYQNKWYKDASGRTTQPLTKTLNDIAKTSPEEFNRVKTSLIPYPGDAIIDALGRSYTNSADAVYLINQLFENPTVHYSDRTKKIIRNKLKKSMAIIQSIAKDLDKFNGDADD